MPAGWDEKGNVVAISISTFDEDEYLILKDDHSDKFFSLIREEVEVEGTVIEINGGKQIKIKRYRIK